MHSGHRFVTSVFLAAALLAPPGIMAAYGPHGQDGREEHHQREEQRRYYDREHKDYHHWDDSEDHAYRNYLAEQHREYREFSRNTRARQQAYWNWRHEHPDHD